MKRRILLQLFLSCSIAMGYSQETRFSNIDFQIDYTEGFIKTANTYYALHETEVIDGNWKKTGKKIKKGETVTVEGVIYTIDDYIFAGYKGNYAESYGRMMLIKGDNDYLYLLGHLENFNDSSGKQHKVGDYISPGNIVAYAGTTGFSTGKHLHLELIECKTGMDDKARSKVLDMTYNQLHEDDGGIEGGGYSCLRFTSQKEDEKNYYKTNDDWKNHRLNPLTGDKE